MGLEKTILEPQKSLGEEGINRGPNVLMPDRDREDEEEDEEEEANLYAAKTAVTAAHAVAAAVQNNQTNSPTTPNSGEYGMLTPYSARQASATASHPADSEASASLVHSGAFRGDLYSLAGLFWRWVDKGTACAGKPTVHSKCHLLLWILEPLYSVVAFHPADRQSSIICRAASP